MESHALQKYGVPFYGAAWVPYKHIRSKLKLLEQILEQDEGRNGSGDEAPTADKFDTVSANHNYVVLVGGGGEGKSGIPNAVVLSRFDFASNTLSNQPVAKFKTDSDLPYRMAVHPRGDGIICAMQNSCRLFEWVRENSDKVQRLGVKGSEKVLSLLEDVGQQLALAFDSDGSTLATGGEDGKLRVLKWPTLEIILNESEAHACVKDLSFSPDGKFLVSLGNRGPGRVWDVTSASVIASLPNKNDEIFASCRFSPSSDQNYLLYIAAITDKGASIVTWNTTSWKRIRSKRVVRESVYSFNVSADGKLLAIGTGGDIAIINSSNMAIQTMVRKAHLGFVTALAFSDDSRALVSASMDSSARVTLIENKKKSGLNLWIIILFVLLAIAVYFIKVQRIIP
ncbi:SEC12-like protein 2 isoform X2 [Mangifera indica]|uniref:SEC12-like protein 2 isoform X2 n=1 Tax=Mangifera indica TaxID=29780 RepID=UPI001CFAE354|nr:SEC12-like protein 2 isoform X2 [Mangifera indica]